MKNTTAVGATLFVLTAAPIKGFAQNASPAIETSAARRVVENVSDPRMALPIAAYTYAAFGSPPGTVGAQAYSLGLIAPGQSAIVGGGAAVWGSPIARLTLIADAQRSTSEQFSPSAAAMFRVSSMDREDVAFSLLGKFKVDGFAGGPDRDEMESEVELGALLSYAIDGWYLDANAIAGAGTGDDGEVDAEGRLRFGRDLRPWLRLGVDGQMRIRAAGPRELPNGRTWDIVAGLQAVAAINKRMFASLTSGPTTVGVRSKNIGATAMLALGGIAF